MTHDGILTVLAIFDGFVGLLIFYALTSHKVLLFPKWHRFFIAIGGAGMLAQSANRFIAGDPGYPVDWIAISKDICIGGLAVTYALIALRRFYDRRFGTSATAQGEA